MTILMFLDIAPWAFPIHISWGDLLLPGRAGSPITPLIIPVPPAEKSRIVVLAAVARVVTHFRTSKTPNGPFGRSAATPWTLTLG